MPTSRPSSTLQMLVVERTDPTRSAARYAVVGVDEALFDAASFARASGHVDHHHLGLRPDAETASEALEIWLARKRRRGCDVSRDGVMQSGEAERGQLPPAS